jgi:hypothetical protein
MVQDLAFRNPAVTPGMQFAVTPVPALAAEQDTVGVGKLGFLAAEGRIQG